MYYSLGDLLQALYESGILSILVGVGGGLNGLMILIGTLSR